MNGERPLAIVTGATSGIGAAFAQALGARGCDVLMLGRRAEVIEEVAREIRQRWAVEAEVLLADLADEQALAEVSERVARAERLAYLVNAAGYGLKTGFLEDTADRQLRMLRVHAEAPVRLCHAAVPRMAERGGGAIINVSSMAGFLSSPSCHMYCSTKAFLNNFSESLAMRCRPLGIHVQALCPGFTRTDFHAKLDMDREQLRDRGPVRWMSAEKVVSSSLRALGGSRVIHVPGFLNRLGLAFVRAMPRPLYYRLAERKG